MSECITASGLTMRFPGCEALRGIDFSVPRGSVFALLGENGAGKTTLIKILTGFQRPSSGSCRVCGLDPLHDSLELRRRVGYVSDAPALYDWMLVSEIGWFAAAFYPDGYLERFRDSIAHYEVPLHRKIRHLSKGQRAKVALALALASDPELLILDDVALCGQNGTSHRMHDAWLVCALQSCNQIHAESLPARVRSVIYLETLKSTRCPPVPFTEEAHQCRDQECANQCGIQQNRKCNSKSHHLD